MERRYIVVGVHSPVNINVTAKNGKQTGISNGSQVKEIVGSQYISLGGSSYVIAPEGEYEITLDGYATGTYSVTVDNLEGESHQEIISLYGASSTPQLISQFTINRDSISEMLSDMNSDGQSDVVTNLYSGTSTLRTLPMVEILNNNNSNNQTGTRISSKKPAGKVAGATITNEEQYLEIMKQVISILEEYLKLINKYDK